MTHLNELVNKIRVEIDAIGPLAYYEQVNEVFNKYADSMNVDEKALIAFWLASNKYPKKRCK